MGTQSCRLESILPNPFQTREREDPEHVGKVALSIARSGLLQVPVGRLEPADPEAGMDHPQVYLAFGHTRLAAYKLLAAGGLGRRGGRPGPQGQGRFRGNGGGLMQLRNVPTPKVPLATILTWPRMLYVRVGAVAGSPQIGDTISWWMAYRGGARRPHWIKADKILIVEFPLASRGGPR